MGKFIDLEHFRSLFNGFEHTAFRLESQDRYVVDAEQEPLRQFLAGEPVDEEPFREWYAYIRRITSEGELFERVRVVTEPHSDYTRFGLSHSKANVLAGEDIRYLPRSRAEELKLPCEDYWLFDSRVAAVFHFGEDGRITGRELVDDPAEVLMRCQWRDVAWHHAIKRQDYANTHGII